MSFVIDGSEWCFDGLSGAELEAAVQTLIERIVRVTTRGETLWFGHDFQIRPMLADRSLWQHELAAQLNHLSCYEDQPEDQWPPHFEDLSLISVGGAHPSQNLDVLWAHLSVLDGQATGCLGHVRAGRINTQSEYGENTLHWLGDEMCHTQFWRDAIELEGDGAQTLRRLSAHAYPNLYFPDAVWKGCGDFSGGYYSQSSELRRYLAALNDFGSWIFTAPPNAQLTTDRPAALAHAAVNGPKHASPSDQVITRRFAELKLDVVPEKPNVRKDKTSREAREIEIGEKVLYCEWHGKLQAYQNRVHIHPPVPETGNKLVIAIFTSHLPLPGD
jgi:hypothetical protein